MTIILEALFYWCLINLATLLPFLLFTRSHVQTGGYSARIRIALIEYLTPYQLGAFSAIAWTVLFAPFLEEILFFGIPAVIFGFWYALLGFVVWAVVHVARIAYGIRFLTGADYWGALISYTLFISLHGWLSLWLWNNGLGLLSIALHSLHNALVVFGCTFTMRYLSTKRRSRKKRRYWRRTKT